MVGCSHCSDHENSRGGKVVAIGRHYPLPFSVRHLEYYLLFTLNFNFEIMIDLLAIVRNTAERSNVPFTQCLPMLTIYRTI